MDEDNYDKILKKGSKVVKSLTICQSCNFPTVKELEQVYEDRNVLAVAFVKFKTMRDPANGGWTPAPDEDSDEWAIIWFHTVMGEVSWHVPREIAEKHLPRNDDREYDGYSRERKNERLWELVDGELLYE